MWKLIFLTTALYSQANAAIQGPIIWGNNNNAIYLPTNRPTVGNACLTVDPLGVISPQTCGSGGGGGGTVTSIDWGSLPSWLTGLGGPITTSGNLGLGVVSQAANKFLASPNGSAGTPSFRSIVAADIPTLNQNTTGSAGSLSTNFASGMPLIGDGTGVPTTGSKSGLTTTFVTAQGAWPTGDGVKIGPNGDLISTGVPVDQAAGPFGSVQYKGPLGNFKGDPTFNFNETTKALTVKDIYLGQGIDQPAGFDSFNRLEPWERTGNKKTLVNTDGEPIKPGFCYVFDSAGNFVSSGTSCLPTSVDKPVIVTGDYTPPNSNIFVLANCAVNCHINLPDISALDGYKIYMKNIGTANAIFHNQAGQQIDGQNDWALLPDKQQVNLISSGGQWYVY
jgi:hypothetical protein